MLFILVSRHIQKIFSIVFLAIDTEHIIITELTYSNTLSFLSVKKLKKSINHSKINIFLLFLLKVNVAISLQIKFDLKFKFLISYHFLSFSKAIALNFQYWFV
ncbi:unknown protein [Desulfotalea psychrophila LSv54]|uniref:Uncharacterized protein n=1 Tax=Desulfotalea psychrophila (strain LSv54 / DSM 12343) TaxID=177439 RepID=Q6AI75_DESPS|nr:unknown protein [Desulfotalea psychrophila LSv54]